MERATSYQVRSHYRFGCRPRPTIFSDGVWRFSGKMAFVMATQHDLMTKNHPTGSSTKQPFSRTERRGSRRCKITQLMRIRPSDPNKDHFEDMRGSVSVSRSGVFFQSSESGYELGIGIKILMEMGIQHSYNFGPGNSR